MPKILIADDAAFMRMMVRDNLAKAGYADFAEARNGAEAVELFAAEKPDLVLLDITMPEKDGITALNEIRELDPEAKVVMCSSMGQETAVIQAVKLGALDFIIKPFRPERLIQTVNNAILYR
jgi:two-component system chemotaxis response regulator CheY